MKITFDGGKYGKNYMQGYEHGFSKQQAIIDQQSTELASLRGFASEERMSECNLTNKEIAEIMLAHGFKIKDGFDDLMPYVYDAARAIEKACAERKDAEIAALRGFTQSVESIDFTKFNDSAFAQNFVRKTMKLHKLIDENGKPTKLLTGEE